MTIFMDFLLEVVGYPIGRLVLPLISLGRARAEPLTGPMGKFNWFGYRRNEKGQIEIETSFIAVIGLAAVLILLFVASPLIGFSF
jgi:hypothetical protein